MPRTTIDFGIDLGTTNSEIAVLKGTDVEVFKNNENQEFTPSVVWIRENKLVVGRKAKEHYFEDPDNAHCEFKLRMGTADDLVFKKSGRRMKPEELSAEVLKSLKADVKQRTGEDVEAAVITVPADFDLPQNQATNKAAQLAGFRQSPLLTEPVAAALTYGFQAKEDKVFWLVYDFGGGTFDAALVQLGDGQIDVVNHGGDNMLGGKLIDWAIVDQLLAPEVARQNSLEDFRRGNPKWNSAFAKLKLRGEEAKISLSREPSAEIYIDPLCRTGDGRDISFEFELKRPEVEKLIDPFVERSINICKKVLEGANLKAGSVKKLILVGGPTLTPYIRERLADKKRGLGIELDLSVDPLTIVARGAAIFAGTQFLKQDAAPRPVAKGKVGIELKYEPICHDVEPPVSGKLVVPDGESLAGYTVELVNPTCKPAWRSGKISVPANGKFMAAVLIQERMKNTIQIELRDAAGTPRETEPADFSIIHGVQPNEAQLAHSVGVAMSSGDTTFFIKRSTRLPGKCRRVLRTVLEAKRGTGSVFSVPLVEGESPRADRNHLIGLLEIPANEIKRDLPVGSEIEVTIDIDSSRLVTSKAYIQFLDQEFSKVINLVKPEVTQDQLKSDVEYVKGHLATLRERVETRRDQTPDDPEIRKAAKVLERIDAEQMERHVDDAYANSKASKEEAEKCAMRVQSLKLALDEIEDALRWPDLKTKMDGYVGFMKEIMDKFGKQGDKNRAAALERECLAAFQARDAEVVDSKIKDISIHTHDVWRRQPEYWVEFYHELLAKRGKMSDTALADQLFNRGQMAIGDNDLEGLKAVIKQLLPLLPAGDTPKPGKFKNIIV